MNGASKNLEQYELKGQIIHQHVRNLAQTLATFHGFNDRLRGKNYDYTGATAISTIMFDQLHLITIRVSALIAKPKWTDDISLLTFAEGLGSAEIRKEIADRAASWYNGLGGNERRIEYERRAERLQVSLELLNNEGTKNIKIFRDKVLAHISSEATKIKRIRLNELWRTANRCVLLGEQVQLLFCETQANYFRDMAAIKKDARGLIGVMRAAAASDTLRTKRHLDRLRRAKPPPSHEM